MKMVHPDLDRIEAVYCTQPEAGAIFRPGADRWYALRVTPQREDQAEAWLGLRGVYGFHPVLTRRVARFGKVREYHRRYLPGYVFARFPGDPLEHAVLACPFITGALSFRLSGEWGMLDPAQLRAIHSMRRKDVEGRTARRADAARRRRASMVRPGDVAMFRAGPCAEMVCEVVELRGDGGARVSFRLFGREVRAEARAADLLPLREGG